MPAPNHPRARKKSSALIPSLWMLWLTRGLSLIAIALASYLTWMSFSNDSVAGCSVTGFDCDAVLSSQWSKWFNLPISLGGVLVYGGIFLTSWLFSLAKRPEIWLIGWIAIGCLSSVAALSGIWFLILQILIVKFCLYCLLTHACGLVIATITWKSMPKTRRQPGPPRLPNSKSTKSQQQIHISPPTVLQASHLGTIGMMTLFGVVSLIIGQIMSDHSTYTVEEMVFTQAPSTAANSEKKSSTALPAESGPPSIAPATADVSARAENKDNLADTRIETFKPVLPEDRMVRFIPGLAPMNVDKLPVCGDPDAEHLILKLMSYTCPHCRKIHHQLHKALHELGKQKFAVVIRPIALSQMCNHNVIREQPMHAYSCHYTWLALAVWHLDATKFTSFHEYLMADQDRLPPLNEAKDYASELIGIEMESLRKEENHPVVRRMVSENHELMEYHAKKLPTFVFGKKKIQGLTATTSELTEIIHDAFLIKKDET